MSYFDHVRCTACRAMLDPEELGPQGMKCPKCGADLSMSDLFGQSATFAEDDLPSLGLEDLVGRVAQPGADYKPPPAPPKRAPGTPPPGVKAPPPAASRPAPSAAPPVRSIGLNAPATATQLARVPKKEDEAEEESRPQPTQPRRIPGQTSAADLMRALKKKR